MTSLSVAMPAYNEEANIEPMINMVCAKVGPLVDDLEIVVCNDGSADATGKVLQRVCLENPRVRVVEHPENQGYGAAVYDAIWATSKEIIFVTDSDLQFDLSELARFLPLIGKADLVIGYRYARSDPWYRRLFGNGWSWLVNLLFGYTARDVDCAFKLFRRKVIETIRVDSRGAMFSAEFLVRARRAGYTFIEEPVSHRPRVAGSQTGARPAVILRAFRELFKLRRKMHREG